MSPIFTQPTGLIMLSGSAPKTNLKQVSSASWNLRCNQCGEFPVTNASHSYIDLNLNGVD